MVRYADLFKLPLAACFVLSVDGLAARADDGYPDYDQVPAAATALDDEGKYEYGETPNGETPNGETPSGETGTYDESAPDDMERSAPISNEYQDEDAGEIEIIRERFPNGSIRIEREVTQDADGNYINHGAWKMFDERGTILAEGHYRNGERDGTWNRWYRNKEAELFSKAPYSQFTGPFVSQASFKNGKLHGKWAIYDSKQHKASEFNFQDGSREGKWILYFANGHKMQEIDYRNGEIDGQYNEWNAEGRQTVKDSYQAGRKLGAKVDYFTNKQKKTEGMYLHAKEIEQTPDEWWTVKLATYTKQGRDEKHGVWVSWYQSGQKQMQGEYRNDLQVGKFEWWYENGQIALRGKYDTGKQVGKWTWWHSNGQKSTQGEYADGNPTGRWRWWDTNGRVHETADLSHGDTKVVDVPMPVHKAELPTPHPAAPKLKAKIKR